mgnify:CR=1 FL=1
MDQKSILKEASFWMVVDFWGEPLARIFSTKKTWMNISMQIVARLEIVQGGGEQNGFDTSLTLVIIAEVG